MAKPELSKVSCCHGYRCKLSFLSEVSGVVRGNEANARGGVLSCTRESWRCDVVVSGDPPCRPRQLTSWVSVMMAPPPGHLHQARRESWWWSWCGSDAPWEKWEPRFGAAEHGDTLPLL